MFDATYDEAVGPQRLTRYQDPNYEYGYVLAEDPYDPYESTIEGEE